MARTYSKKDSPVATDLAVIWDSENSDYRLTTLNDIFTLFDTSFLYTMLEPDTQYSAPAVDGVDTQINSNNNDTHLILTPAATLATGSITLPTPANLRDKQLLIVSCTQQITSFTINGNGASAVNGGPTALTADDFFTIKYDLTMNTWNRVS